MTPKPPEEPKKDEWARIWDARMAGLTRVLGEPGETVLHAAIPFQFRDAGGAADIVPFPNYVSGMTYVTAELTGEEVGQLPSSLGHYELMICAPQELRKAADFISRLAGYTCEAVLEAGQTMDIRQFFGDSSLRAVLFAHPADPPVPFDFLGQRYGLLLCIGITTQELAFARARGAAELLDLLKRHGVYPYTIPNRASVPLANAHSS